MDYPSLSPEELVSVCAQTDDPAAWLEFVRRFHNLIAGVVIRAVRTWGDTSKETVDDLIQDVYLKLCDENMARLREFTPEHRDAMYGYVKTLAANLVRDHFKGRGTIKRGGGKTVSLDSVDYGRGGKTIGVSGESIERDVLIREVDTCLQKAELGPHGSRDRQIFWLYYRVGLTASQIASLPGIRLSTKGVETTILRVTRVVRMKLVQSEERGRTSEGMLPAESL